MSTNDYPNADNYPLPSFRRPITPPDVDPASGDVVSASFNADWIPVMEGALDQLMLPSTWQGTHDEINLALNRSANLRAIVGGATVATVPAPYWDEASDVDAEAPTDDQPWYGLVTDVFAPPDGLDFVENLAIWVLTGFLAVGVDVGVAVAFHTIAPSFVIAMKRGDVGEIFRVVVDAQDAGTIDTSAYSAGDEITYSVVANPALDAHDLYIIKQE